MGVGLMKEVFDHAPADLTQGELNVLLAIAFSARDDTRLGYPGMPELIHRTRLKKDSIQKVLRKLADRGLDIRVPIGVDQTGRPVYACNGHKSIYRFPPMSRADHGPEEEDGKVGSPSGLQDGKVGSPSGLQDGKVGSPSGLQDGKVGSPSGLKAGPESGLAQEGRMTVPGRPDDGPRKAGSPSGPVLKDESLRSQTIDGATADSLFPEPPKATPRKSPSTGVPADFAVTPDLRAWASSKGHTSKVNLGVETEKFINHHTAKGTRFVDWSAAWRMWISKAVEWAPERAAVGGTNRTNGHRPFQNPTDPNAYKGEL